MSHKYTIEEVRQIVTEISDCELLSTEYKGVYEKLRFRCACGREFEKSWQHFRSDQVKGCPACAREKVNSERRLTEADIRARLQSIGCDYLGGGYRNNRSRIRVLCRCGHEKVMALNTALTNNFSGECDACTYKRVHGANRLMRQEVAESCEALGVELVSDTYVDAKSKLVFRCACGREFTSIWDTVKHGKTRCDYCSGLLSAPAAAVEDWLLDHGIQFEKEKSFPGLLSTKGKRLRFDYYLPDLDTLLEYDGLQHARPSAFGGGKDPEAVQAMFMAQKDNDARKTAWCEEQGKTLIRIDYRAKNISEILTRKLIPR